MKLLKQSNVNTFMKQLAMSKLEIIMFKNNKLTLDEVYSKYVNIGSVDTKDINKKEKKNKKVDSHA